MRGTVMDEAFDQFTRLHPGWARGWAATAEQAPAFWNVGTYWRFLSTAAITGGRSTTFEELCPPGVVAPPHVHDDEEAFFVLEGDLVFLLDDQEIPRRAGHQVGQAEPRQSRSSGWTTTSNIVVPTSSSALRPVNRCSKGSASRMRPRSRSPDGRRGINRPRGPRR